LKADVIGVISYNVQLQIHCNIRVAKLQRNYEITIVKLLLVYIHCEAITVNHVGTSEPS